MFFVVFGKSFLRDFFEHTKILNIQATVFETCDGNTDMSPNNGIRFQENQRFFCSMRFYVVLL